MPLGEVLYESGDKLQYVYFPTGSIVSLLYVMADGASAEIAVVGNEGAVDRCVEHNLQLVDGHRALGDLNEIDTLDGSPPDQPEGLDKDAILIGADGGPPGLQQGNVVVGEAGRRHGKCQPIRGSGGPGGREKHRG